MSQQDIPMPPADAGPVDQRVRPLLAELRGIAEQWPRGVKKCEWCGSYSKGPCGCPADVEIERLRATLAKAEHWAQHAMLMRSTQNAELLRILRGEA